MFNISGNLTDATIDSLTIANGNAGSGDGGGILVNSNNTLTLTKSIVSHNTAILGGGIANFGTVTLTDSTVSNNMANAVGGGIYNEGPATLSNSTLSNNISNAAGGGIYNVRTVNVTNSTFSGNATNTSGGGIANFGTAVTLINSTLTNNTADVDNNGDGEGGGIAQFSGTFTTKNTIIASNFDAGSEAPDVFGNVTGDANNLIGSTSGAAGSIGTGTDIVNPNPGLGTLQNNGGFTQTHALLANSPAINGGNNANILSDVTTDQRGNGFDRIKFGTVDIGAFEVQQPILSIIATAPTATEDGNVGTYRISRTNSNGNLTVKLTIDNSSSASVGDYTFNSGSVTVSGNNLTIVIPDGQNFIDINLSAVNDIAAEADETLKLSLVTDAAYSIDTANPNATVTIARNDTVVTNTNDSGEGSLRQAILNANAFAGADIVGFDTAGVFATDQTITLTSGQLTITDDVTIEGTGANNLTVSGNNTSRSFLISRAGTDAILDSLTIANGNAGDANGGGIFVSSGTTLLLTNSNISENQAATAGGIYNLGIATIINSTLSNNQVSFNGGAIYNIGTATITNSTVSGNQATDLGGGIHNLGTAIINNSTITNNTADADNDGDSRGGGVFNPSGTVVVKNTIIAGNVDNSNQAPDVFGNITGDGNNLIGTTAGASGTVGTGSDITFASAGITNINQVIDTSLQNNGGTTATHALVTGSVAINGGSNEFVVADTADLDGDGNIIETIPYDQRGSGFSRINGTTVDIGAYESGVNLTGTATDENLTGTDFPDTINANGGNDTLTGAAGDDILTGGLGADRFVYQTTSDRTFTGDTITDFNSNQDLLDLTVLFNDLGYTGTNPVTDGYLQFLELGVNTLVQIDEDSISPTQGFSTLVTLNNVSPTQLVLNNNVLV